MSYVRADGSTSRPPRMRRSFIVAVLATMLFGLSTLTAPSAHAAFSCSGEWVIRHSSSRLYVSAELGWTGNSYARLRARARSIGPWERFTLCDDSASSAYALRSLANGRYVAAELGWTGNNYGILRARATAIGSWEKFYIHHPGGVPTQDAFFWAANRRYASAEFGFPQPFTGELRARATLIGSWENFNMYRL
jgi:hypothetical protein